VLAKNYALTPNGFAKNYELTPNGFKPDWIRSLNLTARIQQLTVRRPRARTAPRSRRARRGGGGPGGEVKGVVEFSIGQQASIAGDFGPVEFKAEAAFEMGPERLGFAVTHQSTLSD
jgi:hypothetical protein